MTTIGEQLVHVLREAGVTRPPCASTYSPGAPQSNGSPACAVVSRLMSTHAGVGEAIRRYRAHCTALHDSESSTDPRARPGHPKA